MERFFRGWRRRLDIEAELSAARPEPSREYVYSLARRIRRQSRRPGVAAFRLALAGALAAAMLVAVALTGGMTYGASAGRHAAAAVTRVFAAGRPASHRSTPPTARSAAGDEYEPGELKCPKGYKKVKIEARDDGEKTKAKPTFTCVKKKEKKPKAVKGKKHKPDKKENKEEDGDKQ
jgi:hypothetical protein